MESDVQILDFFFVRALPSTSGANQNMDDQELKMFLYRLAHLKIEDNADADKKPDDDNSIRRRFVRYFVDRNGEKYLDQENAAKRARVEIQDNAGLNVPAQDVYDSEGVEVLAEFLDGARRLNNDGDHECYERVDHDIKEGKDSEESKGAIPKKPGNPNKRAHDSELMEDDSSHYSESSSNQNDPEEQEQRIAELHEDEDNIISFRDDRSIQRFETPPEIRHLFRSNDYQIHPASRIGRYVMIREADGVYHLKVSDFFKRM
ncbi:hypothetical protein TNCT_736781 [Trichonephila clavata]|uniref:Uncharacterized protein n=1 Tax=Trichonephila clavata TaxID=2740835 RepID=A0A8X6F1T8_TRICU|nr:hypothetical protein TNCT_736781 [Trichonephila clavata]